MRAISNSGVAFFLVAILIRMEKGITKLSYSTFQLESLTLGRKLIGYASTTLLRRVIL